MRKTIMITALCSFLLFMLAGYYLTLWMGERDKKAEIQEADIVSGTNKLIGANTKIVYQYFYTKDKVIKEEHEPAPVFLQGIDIDQLKSIYDDWQIVFFSPEKVILKYKIDGLSSEIYILGESEGYLTVFYEDPQKKLHLKEKTELPVASLPDEEAEKIREGIKVIGENNLAKLLADYMS